MLLFHHQTLSDIHQGSSKVCFIPVPSISRLIVTDMQGQGKWEEGREGGEGKGRGRREGKEEEGREGGEAWKMNVSNLVM